MDGFHSNWLDADMTGLVVSLILMNAAFGERVWFFWSTCGVNTIGTYLFVSDNR